MEACPSPHYSFRYNSTLCACAPGRYYSSDTGTCALWQPTSSGEWQSMSGPTNSGFSATSVLGQVLPLDPVERVVSSEMAATKATGMVLLFWLAFCVSVRFGRTDGGRTVWFRIRWWISRMDRRFGTSHLLEDLKVVRKRKTELGGTFSVASWILFVGLLSALLYQVITKRSIEVHRIRPTNAPDLVAFMNDLEFNITTVSSMSCSHLRTLDRVVIGTPGSVYYKVSSLSTYTNYTCYNTTNGPMVSLKCSHCKVPHGDHFISWQFDDLPNDPAIAVGFQFNLTAKDHDDDRHVSYISGTLKPGNSIYDVPQTFRGPDRNILKVNLFPQKFNHLHNLRLIQPLLHDFLPGSSFSEASSLQASLQSSKDGSVKTTLYISYLSDYVVEVDKENVVGIVSFLADVGGLYAISIAIFLFFLLQCEARFKKLRTEDSVMRNIRRKRRAQRHWNTLRKYVNYTWGHSNLDMKSISSKHDGLLVDPFCGVGSLHRTKPSSLGHAMYLDKVVNIPYETKAVPNAFHTGNAESRLADSRTNFDERFPIGKHEMDDAKEDVG